MEPARTQEIAADPIVPEDAHTIVAAAATPPGLGARRAIWIVVCYFAAQFIVVFVGVFTMTVASVIQQAGKDKPTPPTAGMLLAFSLVGALLGGALAYRMARRSFAGSSPGELERTLGLRAVSARLLTSAAAVGFGLAAFNALVLIRFFPPTSDAQLGPLALAIREGGWAQHACAAFAVFVAPPVEELVFRGVLFSGLARSWSVRVAACVSPVVFALAHISGLTPYWPAIAGILLIGVATQVARITSASLAPGLAMHAVYNITLMVATYSA